MGKSTAHSLHKPWAARSRCDLPHIPVHTGSCCVDLSCRPGRFTGVLEDVGYLDGRSCVLVHPLFQRRLKVPFNRRLAGHPLPCGIRRLKGAKMTTFRDGIGDEARPRIPFTLSVACDSKRSRSVPLEVTYRFPRFPTPWPFYGRFPRAVQRTLAQSEQAGAQLSFVANQVSISRIESATS
jgi:hypothetical protein